jgi:hypothetical protein
MAQIRRTSRPLGFTVINDDARTRPVHAAQKHSYFQGIVFAISAERRQRRKKCCLDDTLRIGVG